MAYPDPNQPTDFSGFNYAGPGAAPAPVSAPPNPAPTAVPGVAGVTNTWDQPSYAQQAPPPAPAQRQPLPNPQFVEDQQPGINPIYQGPANRGGPVKNALTRMMYGMGQAMMGASGLPTDYEIQQQNFKNQLSLAQQQVEQQKQQLAQQTQQYQQDTFTYRDPTTGAIMQVPNKFAGQVLAAGVRAGATTQAAQTAHNFIPTPAGVLDVQNRQFLPNTEKGAVANDALIAEYPELEPVRGQIVPTATLMGLYKQHQQLQLAGAPTVTTTSDTLGQRTTTEKRKILPNIPGGTAPTGSMATSSPTAPIVRPPAPAPTDTGAAPQQAGGIALPTSFAPPGASGAGLSIVPPAQIQPRQGKQTPAQVKAGIVDMIGQYRAPIAMLNRTMNNHPEIMGDILAKYPDFNATNYNALNQMVTRYTSGGQEAKQINAVNTAVGHAGILNDAINALNNNDLKTLNRFANFVKVETGSSAPAVFDTIARKVSDEIQTAYVATGGTGKERGATASDFDRNLAPGVLHDTVRTSAQLLRSKLGALANQWNNMPGTGGNFEQRFISPYTRDTMNRLDPQGGTAGNQGGGPAGAGPALGSTRIRASDGSMHDIPTANLDRARQIDPKLQVVQ